ncbi:MAG: S41 family peptidase [Bacteroidales bacterium]|nr:S41 family peptidase [Bacteroidales bacterium]
MKYFPYWSLLFLFFFSNEPMVSSQKTVHQLPLEKLEKSRNVWALVRYNSVKQNVNWNKEFKFLYDLSFKTESAEKFDLELRRWVDKKYQKSKDLYPFGCQGEILNIDSLLSVYISDYQFKGKISTQSLFLERFIIPKYFSIKESSDFQLPDTWQRLLSLTKLEYYIRFFYPYYQDIPQNWENLCRNNVLAFYSAPSVQIYFSYVQLLLAKVPDGHLFASPSFHFARIFKVPFRARIYEHFAIVEQIDKKGLCEEVGLQIGDTILKINDVSIERHLAFLQSIVPNSNRANFLKLAETPLFSDTVSQITITVKRDERANEIDLQFVIEQDFIINTVENFIINSDTDSYVLISDSVAWIDLGLLKRWEVPAMIDSISHVKYLIVDARKYPNATIDLLCSWLMPQSKPFVTFKRLNQNHFGDFCINDTIYTTFNPKNPFTGELILLTDAGTASQGEYSVMALKQHPNATQIGMPTGGTLGFTMPFYLPGGIRCRMPVMSFNSPDLRYSQKQGVQPDIFSDVNFTKKDALYIISLL